MHTSNFENSQFSIVSNGTLRADLTLGLLLFEFQKRRENDQ
jgi:hypothetical protein